MDDASLPDLPEGVIEMILSKSDVKSVVRSKSVSKSWQSIISDARFPRIHHLRRSQLPENQNKSLLWVHKRKLGYRVYLIKFQDGKFLTESEFPYPYGELVMPLCSCNGLILLCADVNQHSYLLWNPSLRKSSTIRGLHRDVDPYPTLNHFYYDLDVDDYKIVFVYKDCYAVYCCRDRIWSETRALPCDISMISNGDAVDGCFYGLHGAVNEIVCFDATEGTAEKLRQPEGMEGLIWAIVRAFSGRLCLYGLSSDRRRIQMWVMEKSGSFERRRFSWRKVVALEEAEDNLCMLWPIFLSNKDEVVMSGSVWEKNGLKHFIHNARQKKLREIELDWDFWPRFVPFSENLYMPCSNVQVEM